MSEVSGLTAGEGGRCGIPILLREAHRMAKQNRSFSEGASPNGVRAMQRDGGNTGMKLWQEGLKVLGVEEEELKSQRAHGWRNRRWPG